MLSTLGGRRVRALALTGAGIAATTTALALYVRKLNNQFQALRDETKRENAAIGVGQVKSKAPPPALDQLFIARVTKLLRIVIPSIRSKQVALLLMQLIVLYARTMASIGVARLDGYLVQAIVSKNFKQFVQGLGMWMALSMPAVYINSMIRYLTGRISLLFRTAMVKHVHDQYFDDQTYYKTSQLDSRIANADQMITTDITKFCNALSSLYTDLSKPVMDIVLYSYSLWSSIGAYGPTLLMGFYFVVGGVLRYASPPFGQLAAEGGALEGVFRYCHSRLIQNSEEVAFYGGAEVEKRVINHSYDNLEQHLHRQLTLKVPYSVIESFSLKYVASVLVYCINGAPIFFGGDSGDVKHRTGVYMQSRRMLLDMAAAIQRVMEAYKEVTELSGYTARVAEMLEVFEDMKAGNYSKNISEANKHLLVGFSNPLTLISEDGTVSFDNVPICTPNGDVLVESLNVKIEPGMHLLITGPNGCGKSSLFRILGGLWPVLNGVLCRPAPGDIFYIPQRPYLSLGTFQEQIIYPHTVEDFVATGKGLDYLAEVLANVNLGYVLTREGGWNSRRNWMDRLSGGEKQRVGMARLFYHRPRFAILDECTSQVSIDWEGNMYTYAQQIGVTLLTVSHRPSLWKYHQWVLQFDGEGGVEVIALDKEHRMSLEQEKADLELKLSGVGELENRLEEVREALLNRAA